MAKEGVIRSVSVFLALISSIAVADSPAPTECYKLPTPDQKHVLAVVPPYFASFTENGITYRETGLYTNDSSAILKWTLPPEFCCPKFEPFSDATHLVAWNVWPEDFGTYDQDVLWFFESGKVIRSYKIGDLVSHPTLLRHSTSHYRWIKSTEIDDKARLASVLTLSGEYIRFNVLTGSIIMRSKTLRYYAAFLPPMMIGVVLLLLLTTIVRVIRNKKRPNETVKLLL